VSPGDPKVRVNDALVRPAAARVRRYVETERADRAQKKYGRRGDRAALDAAVEALQRAVAVSKPGDSDYARYTGNLAYYLKLRSNATEDPADLDAAIQYAREAVDASLPKDSYRPIWTHNLALYLHRRYMLTGDLGDLKAAVSNARESARATPRRKRDESGSRWATFERYAFEQYEETGSTADLDAAVEGAQKAVAATKRNEESWAYRRAQLAFNLHVRYSIARRTADLDAAITAVNEAVTDTSASESHRALCLSTLAMIQLAQFERSGDQADLDRAVENGARAVTLSSADDDDRPKYLMNLSALLLRRYEITGSAVSLASARHATDEALTLTPEGDGDRRMYLANRALIGLRDYERTGDIMPLEAAAADAREAVASIPAGHEGRPIALSTRGMIEFRLYERTGDIQALEAAIAVLRASVDGTRPADLRRPAVLSNLGMCLGRRFERSGDPEDLDNAIDALRQAEAIGLSVSDSGFWLSNLGAYLRIRFDRAGDETDINEAVDFGQRAIALVPENHSYRTTFLSNAGASLMARYTISDRIEDLDEAAEFFRAAIGSGARKLPDRPMYLMNHGLTLHARFQASGELHDARESVRYCREALNTLPPDHAARTTYLSNLSMCLDSLAERTGDQPDMADAVEAARDALAILGPDHPDRALCLLNLGNALYTRYEYDDDRSDQAAAFEAWREATEVPTANPAVRLLVARRWGRAAAWAGRWDDAVDGFSAAVLILPSVVWHGLTPATRQRQAARWAGLAADAACCAIKTARPELAVELLEQGRTMLWNQALNLRENLAELASVAPELAGRLEAARAVLNTPSAEAEPLSAVTGSMATGTSHAASGVAFMPARQDAVGQLARAAREYDDVLGRIRTMPGFEHYLGATPYPELRKVSPEGTVVIVNASRYGCHAVVVAPDTDQACVVDLPDLDLDSAADHAAQLSRLLENLQGQRQPFLARERDRHGLLDILGWLWDVIAEPVLRSIQANLREPVPAGNDLPRIWWCPTGPLVSLPLHAAGHHPRHRSQRHDNHPHGTTVLARAVSSYIPTLTALHRASRFSAPQPVRHLTVATPTLDRAGFPPLPDVTTELERLLRYFPPGPANHQLVGPRATRGAVLEEMGSHDWIHLACHAGPLRSGRRQAPATDRGFALWDNDLTITDLAEQPGREGGLAFLSACQTASGSEKHLDEALHLAAAMQFLGYSHIVATMWSIADSPAPRVADLFYATLAKLGSVPVAHALHHAVLILRSQDPTDPLTWAPYVHIGC
jgi:hypothetical protein